MIAVFVWTGRDVIALALVIAFVIVLGIAWLMDVFDRWRKRKGK